MEPFGKGMIEEYGLLLARFFELGLDRSGCVRGVASSNTSCRKRTHDRYFTHGTASVMRMCRGVFTRVSIYYYYLLLGDGVPRSRLRRLPVFSVLYEV